jgi:hypothetical protein
MAYSGGVNEESGCVVVVVVSATVEAVDATVEDTVSGVSEDDVVDSGVELDVQAAATRVITTRNAVR